jgi:hypothetical protein
MGFRVHIFAIDGVKDILSKDPSKVYDCSTLDNALLIHSGYNVFPHRVIIYSPAGEVLKDEIVKKPVD